MAKYNPLLPGGCVSDFYRCYYEDTVQEALSTSPSAMETAKLAAGGGSVASTSSSSSASSSSSFHKSISGGTGPGSEQSPTGSAAVMAADKLQRVWGELRKFEFDSVKLLTTKLETPTPTATSGTVLLGVLIDLLLSWRGSALRVDANESDVLAAMDFVPNGDGFMRCDAM
jgi:hypothetical protein